MFNLPTIVLWLFVLNLGIAMGTGLYESRVLTPSWANLARETWPNTGLMSWAYVTTMALTLLSDWHSLPDETGKRPQALLCHFSTVPIVAAKKSFVS